MCLTPLASARYTLERLTCFVTFAIICRAHSFAKFDRSIATLFRIAAGETWVDEMAVVDPETGQVDWLEGAYVFSYIVLINWTLLQVTVAVLIDNFVSGDLRKVSIF